MSTSTTSMLMTLTLLLARLGLAVVFALAGVAKLADRRGSQQAIIDFGVPRLLARPLAILLPLAELSVAVALIPTASAWWAGVGAFALLLLFVAGIGVNLARGRKPDCHCFGQLHSTPAGWKTLSRNMVIAAVAGFLIWQGWEGNVGPSAVAWVGTLSTAQLLGLMGGVLALGLLAGQWWVLVHLMRQNGRLLVRVEALETDRGGGGATASPNGSLDRPAEGLPVGAKAPSFGLEGLYGETLTLDALRAPGKPVMLLFTDPTCGPCTALLPEIGRWQEEHADKLSISLISRGTPEVNTAKSEEHGLRSVLLQEDWEVADAYQARGTPSAVVVQPDGTIASPVVGGSAAIGTLVAQAASGAPIQFPARPAAQGEPCPNCGKVHAAAPTMPVTREIGEPAPEVKLPDLEGKTVELKDFRGEETLVLFWNTGCGFCQKMLPDLKEWEENMPEGAPRLLFVSAGTEEANKQMGLSSTVVLDQQFAVGRAFGASGTPSGVLVDAEGKIASGVAVGAPAVLELARGDRTAA
jgi:peroxiredoxin/uncharacterized membrane protein YphA (DoxX/SURF4 family)